ELAQEGSRTALPREPARPFGGVRRALRADRELGAVDVDVDRARVDAREIRMQHVALAVAEEVDRHQTGRSNGIQHARSETIELADRIECHSHDVLLSFGPYRAI